MSRSPGRVAGRSVGALMVSPLALTVLPLALALACQPKGPIVDTDGVLDSDPGVADDCRTNAEFFEDEVWGSVVGSACSTCHTRGGMAGNSNLILEQSYRPDFLDINMERLGDMARLTRDGESVLILKPTGQIAHGGGPVLNMEGHEVEILRQFIERVGQDDPCPSPEATDPWTGVMKETPQQTVRRASLLLLGRLPTAHELQPVVDGGEGGLAQALDRLMEDEAFVDRIGEIYRDKLLTEHLVGGDRANQAIDQQNYPNRRWYDAIPNDQGRATYRSRANAALARQPVELIKWVVREGLPFDEILTSDVVMVNDYSALSMGLSDDIPDLADPSSLVYRPETIGFQPVSGLLTTPAYLNRFPSTVTNRNRHRVFIHFDRWLATDILALADREADPTLTETHNPTLNDQQCSNCHSIMDPVAGLYQNWAFAGAHRPPASGWHLDMAPPGFEGTSLPSSAKDDPLGWLAQKTVADPRFGLATVQTLYEGLLGREPVRVVDGASTDEARLERRIYKLQRETLLPIVDAFTYSGLDIRVAVRELLLSPYFTGVAVDAGVPDAVVASAGRRELLGPEDLNRRLTAVTGLPWRANATANDFLLSTYRLLYGGLDFNEVTSRLSEPNGIMVNIAERMAMHHACRVVPYEFAMEEADRVLLPYVGLDDQPDSAEGSMLTESRDAIRRNIQHLHWQILGEDLDLDDPEIGATMSLFLRVWTDGYADVLNGEAPTALPTACRATRDFWTNEDFPTDRRVIQDENYVVRAWTAVLVYLLTDARFLYD